jgi:hypothetical protein
MNALRNAAMAAVAAMALGGAAQASEITISIRTADHGAARQIVDYDDHADNRFERHRQWDDESFHRGVPQRFDGPPTHWRRAFFASTDWRDGDDCRVIVKRRLSRWGELVVRKLTLCD